MPKVMFWLLLHFLIAAAVTWLARHYALRSNLLDQPGERRSHQVATPRGGGVSIVVVLLVAGACLWWRAPGGELMLPAFLAGLLLTAGIGWWDDHRPLSPWLRLAVHGIAAMILAAATYRTTGSWVQGTAALVFVMVLVNVWNFMDGIDGLAASQAAFAAIAFTLALTGPWSWLAAALLAACCGFLPFNFPKARIFLGDVGSGALGFALAGLMAAGLSVSSIGWPLLLLPMSAFLVDASFTLTSRILRRQRWWTPHVEHLYQRLSRRYGHINVTVIYGVFAFVTLALMLVLSNVTLPTAMIVTSVAYLVTLTLRAGLRRMVREQCQGD
ncbi:glycosyltransferase family 4 protein [Pseudoxanthomonas sp. UTMC 1351]|uniref:glycosyltransferase family 4 protein n=1 Tax=Pseudoxanthomonas sp. UTMC 1351 TaxID=2695853 RepID=UPI0034CEA159